MLTLKEGAVVAGNVYINHILKAAQIAFEGDVVITSGRDGQHSEHSYHYQDRALDIRTRTIDPDERPRIAELLRTLLPPYFDVVIESDHFHVEADAKKEKQYGGGLA